MSGGAGHWDGVYGSKAVTDVSWYQPRPATSLRLVAAAAAGRRGPVVDVGAGASTLVDELLADGWDDLTLLDVSAAALDVVRSRLGAAPGVRFVASDVRSWSPGRTFRVWHDRAVFHFLTDAAEQAAYADLARRGVAPGGAVVLATFAADGPEQCSGLPTARYEAADLAAVFADGFDLEHAEREEHRTPWDSVQSFTWVVLRRS